MYLRMLVKEKRQKSQLQRHKKRDPQKTLRNKCLRLWSILVRKRAGNKCEFCRSDKYVQSHHIISKRFAPTRFRLENGIALCAGHHKFFPGESAHTNPIHISGWLQWHRLEDYHYLSDYKKIKEETLEEAYKRLKVEESRVC